MDNDNLQGTDPNTAQGPAQPELAQQLDAVPGPESMQDAEQLTTAYKHNPRHLSIGGLALYGVVGAILLAFAWCLTVEIRKLAGPRQAQATPTHAPAKHKISTSKPASQPAAHGKPTAQRSVVAPDKTIPTKVVPAKAVPAKTPAEYAAIREQASSSVLFQFIGVMMPRQGAPADGLHARARPPVDPRYGPYVPSSPAAPNKGPNGKPLTPGKAGNGSVAPEDRFKISVIMVRNGKMVAIINDKSVHVGDTVDGAKVVAIDKYCVDLEIAGQTFTIRI